jgi:hypothetical protein
MKRCGLPDRTTQQHLPMSEFVAGLHNLMILADPT